MSEPDDNERLNSLEAQKQIDFSRMQSLYNLSQTVSSDPAVLPEFEMRLREIHSTRDNFQRTVISINLLNLKIKTKYKQNYQEITSFDQLYFNVLSIAEEYCMERKDASHTRFNAGDGGRNDYCESRSVKPRLPKLDIFHFDSKLENWQTFYDTFFSLIHNNKEIGNIEKYYYLLKAVSGPALTLVKSMPVTADNYPIIWNLLVKKYENRRVLATNFLDKMFQFKPLQCESAAGLNTFLQTFQECVKALKVIKIENFTEFLLFYIALRNLDSTTRREFEQSIEQDKIPTFEQLVNFVEKHIRVLEMSESKTVASKQINVQKSSNLNLPSKSGSKPSHTSNNNKFQSQKPCLSAVSVDNAKELPNNKQNKSKQCSFCGKGQHSIYKCYQYADLSPAQRLTKVNDLGLCPNCLRDGHALQDCTSKIRCCLCKQTHHHTLHTDSSEQQNQGNNNSAVTLTCTTNSTVVLGTAVVHVADLYGQYHPVRAVIDSGAMSSYMTNACAQRLGLTRRKCTFEPIGLGGVPVQNFGVVTSSIKPRNTSGPVLKSETVIVHHITDNLPTMTLSSNVINAFKDLDLADPAYYKPAPVDLLLASDIFPYIYDGCKVLPRESNLPVAMHSIFGYVITGQTVLENTPFSKPATSCSLFSVNSGNIEKIMTSFWETENVQCEIPPNPDDEYVERLFLNEHCRDDTGRYVVKYPFKTEFELGESRTQVERRFLNLESKLNQITDLKKDYHSFMSEYESLGHMTCLGELGTVGSKYLIPHFCVLSPSSTSTKLRVVFDASFKTSNGNSLNSVVHAGPKLQSDINEILINFRLHEICMSSDIRKMFRMILIDESQRKYQHILWRFSQDQPIQVYELNTVTYGVASSPYLAIRVLKQLADDEADKFPLGAAILKKGFFVDNLLWSVATFEEAVKLQDELIALLKLGRFDLRKWSSNCPELLMRLPEDHRETSVEFQDDKDLSVKVLGLQWRPAEDIFSFTTSPPSNIITKRSVLSQIGRQFDPLGFVAPCVFKAKCIMQKLWLHDLDWDDRLPPELEKEWIAYMSQIPLLSHFRHERQVTISKHSYCQILGFCDASNLGFAAAVYLRTTNDVGDVKVSLLIAKSSVAPTRTKSIPRLELQGAFLLAQLIDYTRSILLCQIQVQDTYLFTDSSVVLAWLNTHPCRLETYVATRVTKILELVGSENWYHVEGACNPADVCSRGVLPSSLLAMPEWLSGPRWSYSPLTNWPVKSVEHFKNQNVPETKNVTLIQSSQSNNSTSSGLLYEITEKYSNFNRIQRVIARCLQFIQNCRSEKTKRNTGSPNLTHLNKAHDILVKSVQQHHFATDIAALQKGTSCSQALKRLNPFIDALGFLRVGGRLTDSNLPYEKKHPILLPKKCNFTKTLISNYHKLHLHVGPRSLQSLLNQKYWIISARSVIRSVISKCTSCFKIRPTFIQPLMGNLPKFRSEDIHAFHTVGVDIGGPFYTKESTRRNAKVLKAYLCLFVCFSTRAVHLEVLTSLSTECFLAAFDRFTSRRGLTHTVVSDNGTNFVGAGRQLAEVFKFLKENADQIETALNYRKINWRFNPPAGSHFGGMYESGIKSAKQLMKKVTGDRALTFEELSTLFSRIEAVLNSRPLCSLSSDPSEFAVLSPGHFLIGRELLAVPEYELSGEPISRLSRWQLVQQASQQFWKLWRKDYLHTLQQRHKWINKSRDIKVGELVLMHSDAPPLQWPLGRVTKVHPGLDGTVRVVQVRTNSGEYTRPVVKLSPLPSNEVESDAE